MHQQTTALSRVLACALALPGAAAQAADFTFSGNVNLNTDIVQVGFRLDQDASNVDVWTDSFNGGTNYDPVTALWVKDGDNFRLVDQNDDNPGIRPETQTYYDSGFRLDTLAAGEYLFTVGAYPNRAYGQLLSEGFTFAFDGTAATPIADWCQPASNDCVNQKGTFWRVNLSGVDGATAPVPEASTWLMFALGLGAIAVGARRVKSA